MKKVAFVLLLACVIMGTAFAQAKPATPAPAPAPAPAQPKAPAPAPAASEAKSGKANAIAGDVFQLVKGFIATDSASDISSYDFVLSYERLISPHFTIGGDFDIYFFSFGSEKGRYFNLAFEGRYYPLSDSFEKIFVGATLGYSQLSIDGSSKSEYGGFSGLNTSLKIGYKYITEKGFFMEPSMSYVLQKASMYSATIGTPLGWNGGLRLGYAF